MNFYIFDLYTCTYKESQEMLDKSLPEQVASILGWAPLPADISGLTDDSLISSDFYVLTSDTFQQRHPSFGPHAAPRALLIHRDDSHHDPECHAMTAIKTAPH